MSKSKIIYFFHCGMCLKEKPDHVSAADFMRNDIGLTETGAIEVWCLRHNTQVCLVHNLPALAELILSTGCMKHPNK